MSSVWSRLARYGLLATLTVATVGCGDSGENDQQSATETWADDVCTSVSGWKDAIAGAQATLSDAANLSANDVRDVFASVATATDTFATDLKGVGPPDTTAGDEAQQQLSSLADQLAAQLAIVTSATNQNSATLKELLAQVPTVAGAVSTMIGDALTTLDGIRQLDDADELETAFESAPACQELQSS